MIADHNRLGFAERPVYAPAAGLMWSAKTRITNQEDENEESEELYDDESYEEEKDEEDGDEDDIGVSEEGE